MHNIPSKVIQMTILLFIFALLFSCSKDSDLLLDSVLNDPEVSLDEKDRIADEVSEDSLVTRTFSFSPTNDAYVQGTEGHDQSIVRLQENFRTSYLMFDLSAVNGSITDAVLQFSIDSDEGDGSIAIHKGQAENWTEENLTIDNAPGTEMQLGSMNKAYKVGAPEKVALDASNLNAEITTLVLTHSSGNDLAFASKEHPGNKGPQLIITYQAPADSPLIEQHEEQEVTEESNQEQTSEENTSQEENNHTNNNTASTEDAYYVTVNGKTTNDGRSEANAWSIEHAFESAIAGDVVYIKAGDYGSLELSVDNSGTSGNPIKFIGYANNPGDVVSNEGSTFKYGDVLNDNLMPLLSSTKGTALTVFETYIHFENLQITGYDRAALVHTRAHHFVAKNLIVTQMGSQTTDDYDGYGLDVRGSNATIENCFVLNANAEGIKLSGADNSLIKYCSVYADNPTNPTDYYIFLVGGTDNSRIENCVADRGAGLRHGGHGFNIKNDGSYNIFKNCIARKTAFELTYEGVHHNTIDGGGIYGISTQPGHWAARVAIVGGAHHNTIKNLYIQDTWTALSFTTFNDRSGADASCGEDNVFENLTIKNTNRIIGVGGGNNFHAAAKRNKFVNCNFIDFDAVAIVYYPTEDLSFKNCEFSNGNKFFVEAGQEYAAYSKFDASFANCTWNNVNFTPPN